MIAGMEQASSDRTTVRRKPDRAHYDRETVFSILDHGLICHIAFVLDGYPTILPTTYGRLGQRLYVHGSRANRALRALSTGVEACVEVSVIDGLVLGRSPIRHSMNYRSVVIYGGFREQQGREEQLQAIRAILGHVVPGRLETLREPREAELERSCFMALELAECSAKIRCGLPTADDDDEPDVWAGVVPLRRAALPPVPADPAAASVEVPANVAVLGDGPLAV
jgi:nitroimidazol reductase NimA-like FMN-containing flavoprotein (pyridoxamine 5'-phosphate oxidase superfamily)